MQVSKLRIDLSDFDQQSGFAVYSAFAVGSELEGYSLKMLGEYRGDAGKRSIILSLDMSNYTSTSFRDNWLPVNLPRRLSALPRGPALQHHRRGQRRLARAELRPRPHGRLVVQGL